MQFGSGERELRIELLPEPEEYGLTGTIEGKTLPGLLGIRLDETPQAERSYEVGALLKLKESKHAVITEDTGTVNQTRGRFYCLAFHVLYIWTGTEER